MAKKKKRSSAAQSRDAQGTNVHKDNTDRVHDLIQHIKMDRRGRNKVNTEVQGLLRDAYKSFVQSDIAKCKQKLEKAMQLSSTCPQIYQTLGTIFEDQGNMEKAFYFFLISAHIKKTDLELWKKLYFFTFELNMLEERVNILSEIQKLHDSKDIVLEKIWLYKELGNDFRASETEAELIKFEGCVPDILYSALSKLKNTLQVRKVCKKVLLIVMKRQPSMEPSFMLQLIYISFKSKCFYYLRKFFHKNVDFASEKLSLDLRLISLITEIMCTDMFRKP